MAQSKKTEAGKKSTGKKRASAGGTTRARKETAAKAPPAAAKTAPKSGRRRQKMAPAISPEQRTQMIREAAYFRAQNRGFTGGEEEAYQDWIEAEKEVDDRLHTS